MDSTLVAAHAADVRIRRRITVSIFVAVAVGSVGFFAAVTVAPLLAVELTGSPTLSGLPNAAGLVGTAVGAAGVSAVMSRRGRRRGLVLGYLVAASGALVAVAATIVGSFALLVAGLLALGVGNSANLLARYAAADVHPSQRRTTVLGLVVWAGTVGAVAGPSLADPAGRVLAATTVPVLAGGLLVALTGFAVGAVVCAALLRPDPSTLSAADVELDAGPAAAAGVDDDAPAAVGRLAAGTGRWSPVVVVALTAMVAGQFVMVLIMTMTPVHVTAGGADLAGVGVVMSLHIAGMYALTPVAGWLADRIGNVVVIGLGLGLLVVAGLLAAGAPAGDVAMLSVALFLLGLGWSFGFVSASGLLSRGVASAAQARLQGRVDAAVFGAAAIASLSSGVLVATVGYAVLCLTGAALVAVPALVVGRLAPAVARPVRVV